MSQLRILVIGAPGILRDVVIDVIRGSADMTVVGVEADPAALPERLRAATEVVVCTLKAPDAAARVLEPYGRVRVVALRDDGRRAALWELRTQRTELGELSPLQLIETIRGRSK